MKTSKPTTALVLDRRRAKADKTFPVKLRVIYDRKNRLFGTTLSFKSKEFSRARGSKPREDVKDLKLQLDSIEIAARKIIKDMPEFSLDKFAEEWYKDESDKGDAGNVFFAFQRVIKQMTDQKRIGSADSYKFALNSLKDFTKSGTLSFEKITPKFLKDYETFMLSEREIKSSKPNEEPKKKTNSLTTVGFYMRCLRAVFNTAIATGVIGSEHYPFGTIKNGKYAIPAPRNVKKALTMEDIKKIFDYKPTNEAESMNRDMWVFSYLCNGANMKDICLLKYKDINDDTISFRRAKTAETNRSSKPITAVYTDELKKIVDRWGNKPKESNSFVFPFFNDNDSPRAIKDKGIQVIKQVNKYIKRIASAVGVPGNITTYSARHSYATTLKRAGVNVSFISESMGHANIKTTESYLGSIEDDQRRQIAGLLTKFGKSKKSK